ncbi:ankyrin repeat domain-containing protein 60 [Cygnus olor]|uniref:ankyrin repeat domain-containing protein 60 n=1 Tax=Cygnus olor TaxID=8869 RepID=UPI001ADE6D17|nr:ankyrin repeat domain-containing protein 60 [Cygnus olor]XP_040431866.1 ankyrin repeat domain-containing protein 60 [Cygnus olor]XP_040431867.1 ankyrin repeat domain-containing protein 60 [Cygnus olor]
MTMYSLPPETFGVRICLAETNEMFSLPQCQNDLTLKKLKSHLELLTGIPLHFQRLQYLDEMDLLDDSTFKDNDIVRGGTITMRIWRQAGWGHLVAAAAKGDTVKLAHLGVTEDFPGNTPYAEILGPEQKKEWVAHRAFVALFVASHRGHVKTATFLLRHGADVHSKTPLGRTALHVAAVMGHCDCIELLLSCGAQALDPDSEGQTAVSLARLWGQQQSERTMVRFQWRRKSAAAVLPSSSESQAMQQTSGHPS